MALGALQFYTSRITELDEDIHPASRAVTAFCTTRMVTIASVQQSKELVASREPAIVIASSGMATGGRVLHHLEAALPDPRNTVLFVGYQAAGTRGRALCDGAKQVKMHGQFVPVAARIERIDSMSAHADAGEIMRWLSGFVAAAVDDLPRARRSRPASGARRPDRRRASVAGARRQVPGTGRLEPGLG